MSIPGQKLRQRSATESSLASRERITAAQDYTMPPTTISTMMRHFDPCVATADMFLYAQGNSIVCCHHDTLTIERRFSRHPDEVLLLAVDNQSERGAGRLVVSYDASQNAIVWDIMSGNEIARFASFTNLTAVAWMRNGAVAFGNDSGTIILFEPETSEHVSFRTIDQIAVTALAPATDCRTFAIGYQNGSILICNLQPRFTILHNLTTSRGPSPIVGLSWHASSTRQRSDMLAVQTYDGDLRVWSVAKSHNGVEPAKVVRILKRTDNYFPGPNWMNWSKNGRIIQFSEGETLSWDVRTKHVTYDSIPTLEHVRGLAVYGPGASLFTLGANNTVQQFNLNAPAVLVADVQHPANLLPPSPPVSVEEQEKEAAAAAAAAAASNALETDSSVATTSESEISIHLDGGVSESDDDYQSPLARLVNAGHIVGDTESDIARTVSATSSAVSHISEESKSETSNKTPGRHAGSVQSRGGMTEYTYMSIGSSLRSSIHPNNMYQQPQQRQQHPYRKPTPNPQRQSVSTYSTATSTTFSTANSSQTGASRPSRLRNEVPRSPDDAKVLDLFKFTRSRLSDVPYRMPPAPATGTRLTNDDLRRQMLYTIFGWTEDIGDLVRDEMDRYPAGSANRILLAKWIGDIDPDIMKASSETMTSSDWMLLALSGIGSQASQHKLGRAYTQRLLESGDVHAAATIMIGMGDCNDAIEIYASHHKYMEALIVAALFYPSVWERQSHLIKKWGEWAIKNGRRELAIRCAACTGKESSEPWTSPSAAQINFPSINSALTELNSPPLSPPSLMQRGPQRSIAKSSALRLITNFGDATNNTRAQIFANQDGDVATPIAAGVTPIVDSAISPGLGNDDVTTAFLRPSQRSVFNTPSSARPGGGSFGRQRLPSIGEGPQGAQDANHPRNVLKGVSDALGLATQPTESLNAVAYAPAPPAGPQMAQVDNGNNLSIGMALQRASTSSPLYRRKEQPPPSPSPASLAMLMDGRHSSNGPRNRIPVGVDLQLAPVAPETIMDMTSPEQTGASSNRYRWPSRRRGPASVSSSVTSNSSVAHGPRSNRFRMGDAPNTSKTLDEYINSLEVVNAKAARASSKDRHHKSRDIGRQRRPSVATPSASSVSTLTSHSREPSSNTDVREWVQTRSRAGSKTGGKRSPRSPVPMSPEDLISLAGTPRLFARDEPAVDETVKKAVSTSSAAPPPVSMQLPLRPSSKSRPNSRTSSRGRSARNRSPDRQPLTLDIPRGRNSSRTASAIRSPSSPLPFSNNAAQYQASDDEKEDYRRALDAQEKFRNRDRTSQRGRSSSQGRRDASPGGSVRARERSRSRRRPTPDVPSTAAPPASTRKDRTLAGPPPAPSAMAVAAGGFERYPPSQQSLGEELGRRRTQSAMTNRGDLRQLSKDERAQRKAAAARELEERRKSLVRHPLAPPIMHPDYLSPGLNQTFGQISEVAELSSDVHSRPSDLPMRSQSTEPGSMSHSSTSTRTRSMLAPRGHQSIGLPATPKAMRLVLEPGAGAGSSTPPSVPPIPAVYGHQRTSSGSVGRSSPETKPSPKKHSELAPAPLTLSANTYSLRSDVPPAPKTSVPTKSEDALTLLPSTVYQPPSLSRAAIPRSMSAPPQELVYHKGSMSQDFSASRKASREKNPTIPESSNDDNNLAGTLSPTIYRRPSLDNMIPPPPPPLPAPPMLKELAHLAVPPPPPPAPLPFGSSMNKPVVYGGRTTGTIEVVMDDGEVQPVVTISPQNSGSGNNNNNNGAPQYANYPPPPPPPPAPPIALENLSQSRNGHQRGRSSTDNSIAGRISRATERIRSASRGPNAASRTKSPEITMVPYESIQIPQAQSQNMGYAPYESVPPLSSFASRNSPPQQHQQQMQSQPQQQLTQQQLAQQQLQLQQIEYQNQMRTGLHQSEMI